MSDKGLEERRMLVDEGMPIAHVAARSMVSYDTLRRGFRCCGLKCG